MVLEKEGWSKTKGRSLEEREGWSETKGSSEEREKRKKISYFLILSGVNTSMVA